MTNRLLKLLGAASFLVATVRLIGLGRRRPHDPTQEYIKAGNADKSGYEPCEQERSKQAAPHHDANNRSSPGDERQQRYERRYWIITSITSVAATFATVVAAGFAIGAYNASWQAVEVARNQTLIAESALIASNRPWVKITDLTVVRLDVDRDFVSLSANVAVKNVGASPAPRTFIRTKLFPDGSVIDEGREAEAMCRETVASGYPPFEALVFPNEAHDFFEVSTVAMELIRKRRNDRIRGEYVANQPVFGEEFAQQHRREAEAIPLRAAFTLIGCAAYIVPVGSFAGQTAFIYSIYFNCGEGPFGSCTFDMTRHAIYGAKDVKVGEPVGGTFAR